MRAKIISKILSVKKAFYRHAKFYSRLHDAVNCAEKESWTPLFVPP